MSESEVSTFFYIFVSYYSLYSFFIQNQEIEAIILECKKELAYIDEISRKMMKEKDETKIKQIEVILNIKIKKNIKNC